MTLIPQCINQKCEFNTQFRLSGCASHSKFCDKKIYQDIEVAYLKSEMKADEWALYNDVKEST